MRTSGLTLRALVALTVAACGSDDGKKVQDQPGGAAGEPSAIGGAGGDDDRGLGGAPAGGGGPVGGTSSPAGGQGGDDGATPPGKDLYVSPSGDDAAPGTIDAPLLTIAHAASIAVEPDRIHLLDGVFDSSTQPTFATATPVVLAAGVTLRAENPGQAELVGSSQGASVALELAGSANLYALSFRGFRTAVRASAGDVTISGLTVLDSTEANAEPLSLSGTAAVTLTPGDAVSYLSNARFFATLSGSASLSVIGGSFVGALGVTGQRGIFTLSEDAELVLSGVDVLDSTGEVLFATDSAKASLVEGTRIEGTLAPASANIELRGESELRLSDATLSDSYWAHISTIGAPTVAIEDSTLELAGSWALIVNTDGVAGPAKISIDRSVISGSRSVLGQIDVRRAAELRITDSQIVDGTPSGIFLGDGAPIAFTLRGSTVTGNGQAGVRIGDHADSTCDLGTLADPGGNTLRGNSDVQQPALLSYLAPGKTCYAVGNTWSPSVQGASAQGTYAAAGVGGQRLITGLVNDGLNYWVIPTGSLLLLAENP